MAKEKFFYYWDDLRKTKIFLSKTHTGGRKVIVWTALSNNELVSLTFCF